MESQVHTTVLLQEAVDALLGLDSKAPTPICENCLFVDATFGRGGHTRLLLQNLPASAALLAFDKDVQAIEAAQGIEDERFEIRHQPFTAIVDLPDASVAGVLMDLGVSSPQLDQAERGFSFMQDGPLDMRMDDTAGQSVAQWLQTVSEQELATVIRDYGEEKKAKAVARAIVRHRDAGKELTTTLQLAQLVADVVGHREKGKHPATRTFQALRIFINDELGELKRALEACLRVLQVGGRLVVISFHSLEDRIVKQFIAKHSKEVVDKSRADWMMQAPKELLLRSLGRVKPSSEEVEANTRARSAVMRVAERTEVRWSAEAAK